MVRVQYHFRQSSRGLLAWDVRRLVSLSEALPSYAIALDQIAEFDENYWYGSDTNTTASGERKDNIPTGRSLVEHFGLITQADLTFPIILDAQGRLMDGMHRVCKAHIEGKLDILVKRFEVTPEPDFIGRGPDSLPYD